ncbi:unnamed protein product [Alternaria alternata]
MDPLSIAGSVSGLVALGELILRRLYRYACHVKNAEKEATELRDEVIALNGVLSSLRVIAQEIQEDQSVSYAINLDYVNSCHATLLELLQKLDTIGLCHKDPNKVRHLTRKIMWPMKTTKFQDFIETIRRHRNNLSFALSADSMTALLKCLGNQERAMEALKAIDRRLRDQHEAETRINYGDEKSQTVVNILAALASQLGRQNEESFEILRSLYTELHPKSRLKRDPEAGELAEAIRNMAVTFDDVRLVVDGLDECSDEAGEAAHILHAIASEHVSISVVILSRDEPHIRQELPQASCHCVAIEAQTKDLDLYVRGEIERRIERKPRLLRDYELKEEMIRKLVSESQGMFGWVSCQLHYLCELSSDTARRKALNDLPRDLTDTYGRVLMRIKKHDIPLARAAFQWIAYESSGLNVDQICDIVSSMTGDDTGRYNVEDILDLCGSLVRRRGRFLELAHFTVLEFLEAIKPEDTRLAVFRLHVDCKLSLAKSCVQYLCSPAFNTPPPADECTLEAVDKEHPFRMYATVFIRRYTYDWLYDPELIEILKKLFEPRKTFNLVNFMLTLLEEATREFEDARAQGFFEDVMNQILEFDDLELFRYLADGPGFESYLDQYIEERWSRSDMKTAERHDLLCLVPRKKAWRILEALLDMDFDLDLTDFSGAWVLRDCVDNGCEKEHLLRRLMTQNAIKPLSCGQTMCHYLAANGNSRILELMLEMYGKELPGLWAEYKGLQPVTLAIHARSSDCALLLLGSMPSGSMRLDDWKNLHSAVAHGLEDVLEQLIELGVDPRALDSKERSALYAVTRYTSKAIIDTLLRQGLDPDHRDSLGRTAILHYLANCKESPSDGTDFVVWQNKGVTLDVVKAITTSKSVSLTVDSKDTLWHQFCVGRLPQILSELSYFSPEDENELGIGQFLLTNSTCAMYERRRNRSGISLLIKTCLDSWSVHSYAARHISSLLQTVIASIDVTIPFIQDSQAIRLLIWSVEQGDTKLTTVLLESGVDINGFSRYYNGRSAIDISCLSKVKPEIFRLLLSKADVKHLSAPDSTGSTWFHQFCVYPDRNQQYTRAPARRYEEYRHYQSHQSPTEVDIVIDKLKATLEAGANPDVTSNNICRSRAIHVAASSGFLEAIVVLDSFGANLELLDGLGWGIVSHAISSRNANLLSFVHEKFPSSELWNVKHSLFAILDGSKQQREYLDCCALHVAAIVGSRPMLQELEYVGFSKDLNAKSKDGLTPLHFAAASGEPAALRWLIDRSVDLNATFGPRNRTALHIAMEMGLVGSSLALIQAGANFNPDSGGVTPEMLIHPTQAGSFQANLIGCDAILPDQVKQNLQSRYRLQPSRSIFHGIVTGNTNQGTPFLSGYGLHEFNRPLRECGGCLPITLALAHQRYAMVDELLQKSVSTGGSTCPRLPARARGLNTTVNLAISDPNNNSRLDLILKRHSEHGTHWLLWGIQPLHVAAAFNPSSIDTLIKCVDALQDTYRNNLLQALSAKDLVGHVLNKNIYIDRTTSAPWAAGGGTPLHIAAWNRQSHAVEKLLGYGADPNSKDPRGRTPLHNAVMSGCAASMKILLQHGAMRRPLDVSLQSPLMLSCTVANADAWSLLAEPRIDASMSDLFGKTALHLSALQDNLKVFVNLVQCGWDMHKKDVHGHSPIFYALLKPQFATWIYADMCKRRETFSASECFELLKSFRCEREIRRFCRRFPEETQRCLRTSCDQQYGTRLFQMAGAAGDMKRVKALLRMVADEKLLYVRYMDISLRSACAANQANTVSQLARKIVWPTDFIEEGDPIMNMPMPETARDNPQIVNWFTARQHTEQLRLTQGNATRIPDATAIKHWSGVTTLRVHLTGSIRRPIGWSLYQYTCYCRSWGSDYWLLLLNSGNTFYMIE